MQNPVFSKNSTFNKAVADTTPAGYPTMPGYEVDSNMGRTTGYEQYAPNDTDFEKIKQGYYGRSADSVDTNRMTYDDVIVKSGILFGFLLISATFSWYAVLNIQGASILMFVGLIGGLILGLINSFKSEPSPVLISAYAVFEGLFLGAISGFYESSYPGVVSTALIATLVTFAVCLALFKTKIVRVNSKFMKILMIGMVSYLGFIFVNYMLTLFGVVAPGSLRSTTIFGLPLGLIISVVVIVLASMSLIADFDFIKKGVESQIPAKYAWTASFGLLVTLIWLYLEFLRFASYFMNND